jgi:hypothetical protein
MAKRVGTWWIRDGLDARREEAQGFGSTLELLTDFDWTEDHGDANVLQKDFVETSGYAEKVDQVDIMFMCTHGSYDRDDSSTWGHAFKTGEPRPRDKVRTSDDIDWGKWDLEYFSSHACRLLYHSSTNSIGRWIPAFKRLHYMFGFHTVSRSGDVQKARGGKFALYAAVHLHWYFRQFFPSYTLRAAWKQANVEVEGPDIEWAYLRANGETSSGEWVSTYNEKLEVSEPDDPVNNRTFYRARGTC